MRVREAMTRQVVCVAPEASILQAGELMLRHGISGLPVVDMYGHVVGIVTERDFLRHPGSRNGNERPRWFEMLTGRSKPERPEHYRDRKIAEIMTRDPVTVSEDSALEEVVRLMESRDINQVPVVRDERLVGIVTSADMLRALMRTLKTGSKRDENLRQRLTELERQSWLHRTRAG
jgi:CBS domain-containing protein